VKKYLPYILGSVLLIALGTLLISSVKNRPRKFNDRVTFKERDKIPYGFYAARQLLPSLFPNADLYTDRRSPGYWDSLSAYNANQAVFIVGLSVKADDSELEEMVGFASKGNYVFIITQELSFNTAQFFKSGDLTTDDGYFMEENDSLQVKLAEPRFTDKRTYVYPGRRYASYFDDVDTAKAVVLGTNENGKANFVQYKVGTGAIFIHAAPMAFSNYFILHKNNAAYYQQVVSVIPASVNKVLWNEYYLNKKTEPKQDEPNWLSVLMKYEAFRWALWTAIITLLLYVLMEMRRKQRVIPVMPKPTNDSLDFVKTIGQLYYDRKDHTDMARKMGTYYLDHVRSHFKVSTNSLDDSFIQALYAKSGYPVEEIKNIVDFIGFAEINTVNEYQLNRFYNQLETFYQNT
jgi:hypothetical protein